MLWTFRMENIWGKDSLVCPVKCFLKIWFVPSTPLLEVMCCHRYKTLKSASKIRGEIKKLKFASELEVNLRKKDSDLRN